MSANDYEGQEFEAAFVVEFATRDGKVSERYVTYEEALRRLEQFAPGDLVVLPLIFRELADGSERAIREDGKPLQFHRVLVEDGPSGNEAPVPLADGDSGLTDADGRLRLVEPRPCADDADDVIPWPLPPEDPS